MGPSLRLFAAALCAALTAAPMAAGASSNSLYDRLLASQNRERAMVGVGPLQWDPALAMAAASYGPALASLPHLRHSPKATRPGQRENLWKGSRGYFSPEQMVGTWAAEKRFFHAGVFPAVSSTGDWEDVAHYTAMVWPTTTRVGCAVYSTRQYDYLICRYSPPGNIDGRPVQFSSR